MSKPDLYICHTPYHVLVDLARALRSSQKPDFVLAAVLPGAAALASRLCDCGAVGRVQVFDERTCDPAPAGPLQHWFGVRNMEKYAGFSLDPGAYAHIYIHNDWSALGQYLQDRRMGYILCEDTFASTCWPEHPLIVEQRAAPDFEARQRSGRGYLFWGDYRGVQAVETEDLSRCSPLIPKAVEDRKRVLLDSLTAHEKAILRQVFLTAPLPENAQNATLLLPRDFVGEGTLTREEQDAMWQAVAEQYSLGGPLFVKTHPRDDFDYSALFPQAILLDRAMPSELLNFALPFRFARAVTVGSTVLSGFSAADDKVSLSLAEARGLAAKV